MRAISFKLCSAKANTWDERGRNCFIFSCFFVTKFEIGTWIALEEGVCSFSQLQVGPLCEWSIAQLLQFQLCNLLVKWSCFKWHKWWRGRGETVQLACSNWNSVWENEKQSKQKLNPGPFAMTVILWVEGMNCSRWYFPLVRVACHLNGVQVAIRHSPFARRWLHFTRKLLMPGAGEKERVVPSLATCRLFLVSSLSFFFLSFCLFALSYLTCLSIKGWIIANE